MGGKGGVSPSYVALYIDLSLYSPLPEVISDFPEEFLIWFVLNQGNMLSATKCEARCSNQQLPLYCNVF